MSDATSDAGRIRFIVEDDESNRPRLTLYLDERGQLTLLRALASLGPTGRHFHLEGMLTAVAPNDAEVVDLVFIEGKGDLANAPAR